MTLTLTHYLVLSALLLGVGILTMVLKRNPLGILMGAQLVAAAAALNFIAFNAYHAGPLAATPIIPQLASPAAPQVAGQLFALFIILLTALQAALALALFLNLAAASEPPAAPATPV